MEISRPNIVKIYNAHMSEINISDMLLEIYRNQRKSIKWYIRIVYYLVWMSFSNCWWLYRESLTDTEDTAEKRTHNSWEKKRKKTG